MWKLWMLAACAALVWGASAPVNALPLGSVAGTTVEFIDVEESSDTGDSPLYLAAMTQAVGDSLVLVPSAFGSSAVNGSSDMTAGLVTFTVNAQVGFEIASLRIDELGDWSLIGEGGDETTAAIASMLEVSDASGGAGDFSANAVITPGSPYVLNFDPARGVFDSSVTLDLGGLGITSLDVRFASELGTTSGPGTAALIQKKSFVATVQTARTSNPIPEPGSLLLFGAGIWLVGVAVRRSPGGKA